MTKNSQEYMESLAKARLSAHKKVLKKQEKDIILAYNQAFKDAYFDLLNTHDTSSFTSNAAKTAYVNQLYREMRRITAKYNQEVTARMAMYGADVIEHYLPQYKDTELFEQINKNVKKLSEDNIRMLVQGEIYKDGKGLSSRLWNATNASGDKIELAIQSCVARGLGASETAQIIKDFATEGHRTWDRKKIREKLGPGYARKYSGGLDYEALRLARTTSTHLAQLSSINNDRVNPYSQGVKWKSAHAAGRTCDLCEERDGKIYSNKDCPMDHPNGMCYLECVMMIDGKEVTPEQMAKDIGNWIKGEPNSGTMDKLYKDISITPKPKKKTKTETKPKTKQTTPKKSKTKVNKHKDDPTASPRTGVPTGQIFTEKERATRMADLQSQLEETLSKCRGNTKGYKKHVKGVMDMLKTYPPEIQDLYLYGTKGLKIMHTNGGACYTPATDKIKISMKQIADSLTGYTTFFHETAHRIDNKFGTFTSAIKEDFYSQIEKDVDNAIKQRANGVSEFTARLDLKLELQSEPDYIGPVSDLYGGVTDNEVTGNWGHSKSYWNRRDKKAEVCSEAWADILQSYGQKEQTELMNKYLPGSKKYVEEYVKNLNEAIKSGKVKWR
jgi:hypothetical protein